MFVKKLKFLCITYVAALLRTGSLACVEHAADIGFLLDASASEGVTNFKKQVDFVRTFVQQLEIGPQSAQVGLVTFDTNVHPQFWLNQHGDKGALLAALQNVPYNSGATYTHKALAYMRTDFFVPERGARDGVPKVMVLLTDGQSTSPPETAREALLLKQSGVHVIAVGIGSSLGGAELQAIASGLDNVFTVAGFSQLLDTVSTITAAFCHYLAAAVTVPGTGTTPSTGCGDLPADVVFVLDSSGSEGPDNFRKQLDFVSTITAQMTIGPNNTQVALLTFSTSVHNKFFLDELTGVYAVLTAISRVPFESGATYTGQALQFVRLHTLSTNHGRRNNSHPIVIVLTDGQSSDRAETLSEASLLKNSGVEVLAIGIGNSTDSYELQQMATDASHVFSVRDFDNLASIRRQILERTCAGAGTQPTVQSECGTEPVDIVFLLDSSSSETVAQFDKMKEFVSNCAQLFEIGPNNVQVSVVSFSTSVQVEFYLNAHHAQYALQEGIARTAYLGGLTTQTAGALAAARSDVLTGTKGASKGAARLVILITDGRTTPRGDTLLEAGLLKQAGAQIVTVAIGAGVDHSELDQVASDVRHAFTVASVDTLDTLKDELVSTACEACSDPQTADILFILDASTKDGEGSFVSEVSFATSFLNQLTAGADHVQFAALTYASLPNAEFWFNSYSQRREMVFALQTLRYSLGSANLAGALRFAKDYMFDSHHGSRASVPRYAIVVTDEQSNNINDTIAEANRLKQEGVIVISVGVGNQTDQTELNAVATDLSYVFHFPDYKALSARYQEVKRRTCRSITELTLHTSSPALIG